MKPTNPLTTERAASDQSERVRRVLRLTAAALLIAIIIATALVVAGTFDPKPFGPLLQIDRPGRFDQRERGERTIELDVPWPAESPPERFSVRLTAAQAGGDPDSGYGLAIGDGRDRLIVAVSPLGYAAVREETDGRQPVYLIPWSTWPHVRTGDDANEIWLDIAGDDERAEITVMINRELFWRQETAWRPDRIGLWLAAFDGPVEVEFRSLEWFAEPADQ